MARVSWHVEGRDARQNTRGASFGVPSESSLFAYFKAARIAIPDIPNPEDGEWFLSNAVATISMVVFELHNDEGERGLVVVDRKAASIGF